MRRLMIAVFLVGCGGADGGMSEPADDGGLADDDDGGAARRGHMDGGAAPDSVPRLDAVAGSCAGQADGTSCGPSACATSGYAKGITVNVCRSGVCTEVKLWCPGQCAGPRTVVAAKCTPVIVNGAPACDDSYPKADGGAPAPGAGTTCTAMFGDRLASCSIQQNAPMCPAGFGKCPSAGCY